MAPSQSVDYEGTGHLTVVPQLPLERFNLIARLDSADAAQTAQRRLREACPAAEVLWLGYLDDGVHAGSGLTASDSRLVRAVVRDMIVGGVAIGVAGAVAGMVLALISPLDSLLGVQAGVEALGAGSAIGGLLGITAGALVGGEAGLDRSQAGSDPYDDQIAGGAAVLGIRADSDKLLEQALGVLHECGALAVRRFASGEEPTL